MQLFGGTPPSAIPLSSIRMTPKTDLRSSHRTSAYSITSRRLSWPSSKLIRALTHLASFVTIPIGFGPHSSHVIEARQSQERVGWTLYSTMLASSSSPTSSLPIVSESLYLCPHPLSQYQPFKGFLQWLCTQIKNSCGAGSWFFLVRPFVSTGLVSASPFATKVVFHPKNIPWLVTLTLAPHHPLAFQCRVYMGSKRNDLSS